MPHWPHEDTGESSRIPSHVKLTHWDWVFIYTSASLPIVRSNKGSLIDNGQVIIWNIASCLLIEPQEQTFLCNFDENQTIVIQKKCHECLEFDNVVYRMVAILSWPQYVDPPWFLCMGQWTGQGVDRIVIVDIEQTIGWE